MSTPAPLPPYQLDPKLPVADEQSFLQFVIGRYDSYFDGVHNKANFWLAFNTFALGGLIAGYKDFVAPLCVNSYVRALDAELVLFLLVNLASTFFIMLASLPYLKRDATPPLTSAVYFLDVAAHSRAAWHQHMDTATMESLRIDQREQAHELAIGLVRKYRLLYWAGALLLAQVFIVFALCITYALHPACPPNPPPSAHSSRTMPAALAALSNAATTTRPTATASPAVAPAPRILPKRSTKLPTKPAPR